MQNTINRAQGTIEEFFGKIKQKMKFFVKPAKLCFAREFSKKSIAQGTIEYLVIIAVVVLLSLVVVGLVLTQTDSGSNTVGVASKIAMKSSGIGITEAVSGEDGNLFLNFVNNLGETITVTGLVIDGVDFNGLSEVVSSGATRAFLIPEGVGCEGASQVYNVIIEYVSAEGLPKSYDYGDIEVECTPVVTPIVVYVDVDPVEEPINGVCGSADGVVFSLHEDFNGDYTLCDVGELESIPILEESYDATTTWTCLGENGGSDDECSASRESESIYLGCWSDVADPHPICTCSDLNKIRDHLSWDYELQQDVNCEDTINWDDGAGFERLGAFSGVFDGNSHRISHLFINRPGQGDVALFSEITGGVVKYVGLEDINYTGSGTYTGAIAGKNMGLILGAFATGEITATSVGSNLGGLSGTNSMAYGNYGFTINSYADVNIYSSNWYVGGISGYSTLGTIENVFSSGNINGDYRVGGVNGYDGSVSNAFFVGEVYANTSVGGINGVSAPIASYWYDNPLDDAIYCWGSSWDTGCTKITDDNGGVSWFYSKDNGPIDSWGTWVNTPGSIEWHTIDGNWSICEGTTYPWLTWENRTCPVDEGDPQTYIRFLVTDNNMNYAISSKSDNDENYSEYSIDYYFRFNNYNQAGWVLGYVTTGGVGSSGNTYTNLLPWNVPYLDDRRFGGMHCYPAGPWIGFDLVAQPPDGTGGSIYDGDWHHFEIDTNDSSSWYFIDGNPVWVTSRAYVAQSNPTYPVLGYTGIGGYRNADAAMEIASARIQRGVRHLYNQPFDPPSYAQLTPDANTIASWMFLINDGSLLIDTSGNDYNLLLRQVGVRVGLPQFCENEVCEAIQ
jgi:hypothetical protein